MPNSGDPHSRTPVPAEIPYERMIQSVLDYAIFMIDPKGRVMSWNSGAEQIKGWRADEIIGRSFATFYTREAVATDWPNIELRCAAKQGRFEDRGWRVRKDGSRFWANVVITAIRNDSGELLGFTKVTRDLTSQREQEDALRQSEEQFRLLVESVHDHAMFIVDPGGFIQTWNSGAQAIHGYPAAQAIGRNYSMFYTEDDIARNCPQSDIESAMRDGVFKTQAWRRRRDGTTFLAEVKLSSVRDSNGRLIGFAQITRDLSEQRRMVDAESAKERMTNFLAMLSHELRNPLASIRNGAEIMRMQPELSPTLERVRDVISRQSTQLNLLVDDLLDIGRLQTGKLVFNMERIDYGDVVRTATEAFSEQAAAKQQQLEVRVPEVPLPMRGDAGRLVQALQNVLANAIRYTPSGGRISVDVQVGVSTIMTSVTDNGPGIDPGSLERIFELFVQGETPRARWEGGLGIGLSLARALVVKHGGIISAHSAGAGRGSTFLIRLPRAVDDFALAAPQTPAVDEPLQPHRILVVDDNVDAANSLADMLRLLGNDVVVSLHGIEALEISERFKPDCALIDLDMPQMDGCTLVGGLRAIPGLEQVRAAAVTGHGQPADHDRTRSAGFDDHLVKPVDVSKLKRFLQGAVRQSSDVVPSA